MVGKIHYNSSYPGRLNSTLNAMLISDGLKIFHYSTLLYLLTFSE